MTIKVLHWDKHGDEFERISKHLALEGIISIRHISQEPPLVDMADIFFIHEGPWLDSVPQDIRQRCILAPCIKLDGHVETFKKKGFRHAVCKTNDQLKVWNDEDSIVVPNICDPQEPPNQENQKDIISLINGYKIRDKNSFSLAKQIPNIKMYGIGEEQLGWTREIEVLKTAKFLIHIKNMGYVCNAVIKAIAMGVPVITTESTMRYGYEELLIHNFNAIICKDINGIIEAINTPQDTYIKLRDNCLSMKDKLTVPNLETSKKLMDMIHKLYNKTINSN
jgi:glycosyltransferase involved in cell wall biosynthesis